MTTVVLVLAAWVLVAIPLALLLGRALAGGGRHRRSYAVTARTPTSTSALAALEEWEESEDEPREQTG